MQARREQMARLRARIREPGLASSGHAAMLGGLAPLEAMVRGEVRDPPITRTLDFYLLEVARGRAVFAGQPQFVHHNPIGTGHRGGDATLLDAAVACAVHTLVESGPADTTLEFKVHREAVNQSTARPDLAAAAPRRTPLYGSAVRRDPGSSPGLSGRSRRFPHILCVRPLTDPTGPVRAEGTVAASGKRAATAEGRPIDADGKLYSRSHGTTSCLFIAADG